MMKKFLPMKPLTFRTQLLMNGVTLVLATIILLASHTFASSRTAEHPAAVPQASETTTISYQGQLTDKSGKPFTGSLPMVFNLYTAPTGGNAVWTEERSGSNAVPVTNGLFNVMLGSVTPIDSTILAQDLWLGISVDGDSEMTPREQLGKVPAFIPNGSLKAEKLALDHGTICLSQNATLALPGNWERKEIPGLSLDFTLDDTASVLVWIDGLARFDQEAAGYDQNIMLELDGVDQTNTFTTSDKQWFNIEGQRILTTAKGPHTLKASANSFKAGTLEVHGTVGYRTCINYLVVGK